jgi:UDP-N-acetylglucosamine 4-epimerase
VRAAAGARAWRNFTFIEGDVRHSQADISKARKLLGYASTHRVREALKEAMGWYIRSLSRQA